MPTNHSNLLRAVKHTRRHFPVRAHQLCPLWRSPIVVVCCRLSKEKYCCVFFRVPGHDVRSREGCHRPVDVAAAGCMYVNVLPFVLNGNDVLHFLAPWWLVGLLPFITLHP